VLHAQLSNCLVIRRTPRLGRPVASLLRVATLLVPIVAFALQPAKSFADSGTLECNNLPGGLQYYLTTATAGSSFTLSGTCIGNFTINKPMTLQGGTLQGVGGGPVLTINPGSGTVDLSRVTVTGGVGKSGPLLPTAVGASASTGDAGTVGGIAIQSGTVTIDASAVTGNTGGHGGAGGNDFAYAYGITCSGGAAANYVFSYTPGSVTVNREDATVEMSASSNAQIVGSGPITLSATVRDSAASGYSGSNPENSSGTVGDVTRANVEFDIYNAASCLTGPPLASPVVPVTATGTQGVGTATYSLPSPLTEASYCVVPRVAGATAGSANPYYTAPAGSLTGIAFYQNTGQFATGGGWLADSQSSSGRGSVSFNARYTKTGGAKGQMAYIWQGMYNGQLANYIVTSNAITSLTFTGASPLFTATLQGKSAESIVSVATGQVLYSQGNLTFIATATDADYGLSQNTGSDAFSLSVFTSTNQAIKRVTATPLSGGNFVVHNG